MWFPWGWSPSLADESQAWGGFWNMASIPLAPGISFSFLLWSSVSFLQPSQFSEPLWVLAGRFLGPQGHVILWLFQQALVDCSGKSTFRERRHQCDSLPPSGADAGISPGSPVPPSFTGSEKGKYLGLCLPLTCHPGPGC